MEGGGDSDNIMSIRHEPPWPDTVDNSLGTLSSASNCSLRIGAMFHTRTFASRGYVAIRGVLEEVISFMSITMECLCDSFANLERL